MLIAFKGPKTYVPINNFCFALLLEAVEKHGFHLSGRDRANLKDFYHNGANALAVASSAEEFELNLTDATNRLIDLLLHFGPAAPDLHGGFKQFLHSLCPAEPFC